MMPQKLLAIGLFFCGILRPALANAGEFVPCGINNSCSSYCDETGKKFFTTKYDQNGFNIINEVLQKPIFQCQEKSSCPIIFGNPENMDVSTLFIVCGNKSFLISFAGDVIFDILFQPNEWFVFYRKSNSFFFSVSGTHSQEKMTYALKMENNKWKKEKSFNGIWVLHERELHDKSGFIIKNTREKLGILDSEGNIPLPPEYDSIDELSNKSFLSIKKDDLYGIFNTSTKEILLPAKYDSITSLDDRDYLILKAQKKYKIFNLISKKFEVDMEFEDMQHKKIRYKEKYHSFFIVKLDGKYAVYDTNAHKLILSPEYEEVDVLNPILFRVKMNGKYGVYSLEQKKFVIPVQFDEIIDTKLNLYGDRITDLFYLLLKNNKKLGLAIGSSESFSIIDANNDDFILFRKKTIDFSSMEKKLGDDCFRATIVKIQNEHLVAGMICANYLKDKMIQLVSNIIRNEVRFFAIQKNNKFRFLRVNASFSDSPQKPDPQDAAFGLFSPSPEYDDFRVFESGDGIDEDTYVRVVSKGKKGILLFPTAARKNHFQELVKIDPDVLKRGYHVSVPPQYDEIELYSPPNKNEPDTVGESDADRPRQEEPVYLVVTKNSKRGILDGFGREILPAEQNRIESFIVRNGVVAWTSGGNLWKIYVKGKPIHEKTCRKISILRHDESTGNVAFRCMNATLEWETLYTAGVPIDAPADGALDSEEFRLLPLQETSGNDLSPNTRTWANLAGDIMKTDEQDEEVPWIGRKFWIPEKMENAAVRLDPYMPLTSDALGMQPGVYLYKTHPGGGMPLLMGPGRSQRIFIDGIPLAASVLRPSIANYINIFPHLYFQQVDLVHGPSPAMFGSSAGNGVIHFIPHSLYTREKQMTATLMGGYRSIDKSFWGGYLGIQQDKEMGLILGISGQRNSNLKGGDDLEQDRSGFKAWSGIAGFSMRNDLDNGIFSYLIFSTMYMYGRMWDAERPFAWQPSHYMEYDDQIHVVWSKMAFGLPKAGMHVQTSVGYQSLQEQQTDPATRENAKLKTPVLDLKLRWDWGNRTQMYSGFLAQLNTLSPESYVRNGTAWTEVGPSFPKDSTFTEMGVFALVNHDWIRNRDWLLSWKLGGRMESLEARAGDIRYDMRGSSFSSTISLKYRQFSTSFSGSMVARIPNLYESAYSGHAGGYFHVSNPELNPENITSAEMRAEYLNPKFNVAGGFFQSWVEQPILLEETGEQDGLIQVHNVNGPDRIQYSGTFVRFQYRPSPELVFLGHLNQYSGNYDIMLQNSAPGLPLTGYLAVRLDIEDDDDMRWLAEAYMQASETMKNKYDHENTGCMQNGGSLCWYTLNLRGGVKMEGLGLYLSIENILDARYRPYGWGYYAPGLTFFGNLVFDAKVD